MNTTSYLLLRLAIGASMFGHGLVRIPKLQSFSTWLAGTFEKSILPRELVTPFSYALPFAEFLVGFLLLIGLYTEKSLIAGGIVMLLLIFGTTLIENWEALPSQLIHIVLFALLLQFLSSNGWSLDTYLSLK
ncbi:DoxX family protein [Flavobacterium aquicola]|uniref:Thiosulfate dehydrogenase [quinone] large subunit n=1 Tax=Flavobacterium aquicola TaxID=1682742 RepID=A0A3E0EKH0_9FLAO|nr:DoxX family membrane protein [Flavobacterium aquicola]REG98671.1 thiosulfate dehydrogenase [quinone] large subunit [Flavobacterium aquicola]